MAVINGGLVPSISSARLYEELNYNKTHSKYLTQHRTPKFRYLADRMVMVNPQLKEVLEFVKGISEHWYISIKSAIVGRFLRMYMVFQMYPQQFNHQAELLLFANYSIIKNYLQRIIKVLISNYGFEDKYYKLYIPKKKLHSLSKLWAKDTFQTSLYMVKHYEKLKRTHNNKPF